MEPETIRQQKAHIPGCSPRITAARRNLYPDRSESRLLLPLSLWERNHLHRFLIARSRWSLSFAASLRAKSSSTSREPRSKTGSRAWSAELVISVTGRKHCTSRYETNIELWRFLENRWASKWLCLLLLRAPLRANRDTQNFRAGNEDPVRNFLFVLAGDTLWFSAEASAKALRVRRDTMGCKAHQYQTLWVEVYRTIRSYGYSPPLHGVIPLQINGNCFISGTVSRDDKC